MCTHKHTSLVSQPCARVTIQVVMEYQALIHRSKKVELIELFASRLLLKQEDCNLQIINVRFVIVLGYALAGCYSPSAAVFWRSA